MTKANDDGPGRPVSRDEPYYAGGIPPAQGYMAHCGVCGEMVPIAAIDYRWFVMIAIKAGWRLDKSGPADQWTCPACAAVARANLDAVVREETHDEFDEMENKGPI